jgi:secreted trypsin-like serine protease
MKKLLFLLVCTLLLLAASAAPAAAVTFGQADNGAHPNVGLVVVGYWEDGTYVRSFMGSGTLVAPGAFLTAGHVADAITAYGMDFLGVSFEERLADVNTSNLLTGTMILHPNYRWGTYDKCDLAVVLLDPAETAGLTPAELPSAGLLDAMAKAKQLRGQAFTCVGYGLTERTHDTTGPPVFGGYDDVRRRYVTSGFHSLTPAWIHMSQNPALGDGGSSYGDSGGPNFLGTSNVVVAVTSWGDMPCRNLAVNYRLDTPSARGFLGDYMPLP